MSRLLPARFVAGSGSVSSILRVFEYPTRPALHGVSQCFSTTTTTTHYEQSSRQQNENSEPVEWTKQDSREGAAQPNKAPPSRTPRHSLSGASPSLDSHEAHYSYVTDNAIPTREPSINLQLNESFGHKGAQRGGSGPQSALRSPSNDEDTHAFRLPRSMHHLPPLGTLPRISNSKTQDYKEGAPLHEKTRDVDSQKKDFRKDVGSRDIGAKAGSSTAIEHLPIHPDLLKTILETPELYGATPLEANAFHCLNSGKDVFIQQHADSNPAHLLPIVQKVISNQERRPGSSFVQTVTFARHIAKIRSISVLILSPWRPSKARSVYATKKLLRNFPGQRVSTALFGKSPAAAQQFILEGCDILVAHPRMLAQLLDEADQRVEIRRKLERLQAVVIEDADVFVNLRCMPELHYIINEVSGRNGGQRSRPQGVVVSATGLKGPVKALADALLSPGHEHLHEQKKVQKKHPLPKRQARG